MRTVRRIRRRLPVARGRDRPARLSAQRAPLLSGPAGWGNAGTTSRWPPPRAGRSRPGRRPRRIRRTRSGPARPAARSYAGRRRAADARQATANPDLPAQSPCPLLNGDIVRYRVQLNGLLLILRHDTPSARRAAPMKLPEHDRTDINDLINLHGHLTDAGQL